MHQQRQRYAALQALINKLAGSKSMQNPIEVEARQYEESAYATGYVSGYEAAQGSAAYALEYARHARQQDASNYARGYCDGFNAYAVECGSVAPTDDEIVKRSCATESDAARAIERQQERRRARRAAPVRVPRAAWPICAKFTTRTASPQIARPRGAAFT